MLGVIVAVWLSERRWRARGGQKGTIIDIAVPAVIFGLIGGRLYHVITDWQTYFGSRAIKPAYKALFIWEGGLGIWGAIALGGVGVWWAARRRGLSMTALADTIAPGIAFGQAIGRWGNWFNQELYGGPTTLPWGLEIDADHGGEPGVLYHPTFLYESIWDVLLGFALILVGRRLRLRHGRLFALYVAGYTLGRFWIEGLRIDPVGGVDHAVFFLGLRINQWTSIVLFVGALVYFWATRNKEGVEVVVSPSAEADPAHAAGQSDPGSTDDTLATGAEPDDRDTSGPDGTATTAPDGEAPAPEGTTGTTTSAGTEGTAARSGTEGTTPSGTKSRATSGDAEPTATAGDAEPTATAGDAEAAATSGDAEAPGAAGDAEDGGAADPAGERPGAKATPGTPTSAGGLASSDASTSAEVSTSPEASASGDAGDAPGASGPARSSADPAAHSSADPAHSSAGLADAEEAAEAGTSNGSGGVPKETNSR
ncbi:prolipoprotein diacylglyceryl transferase [Actinomadura luzonensis]|uniref:prolipoprotein diacylglyceryl transferase n=1 Tax=Actinomadura luzonensis TaxID=2805427 RepID=UPI00389920E1